MFSPGSKRNHFNPRKERNQGQTATAADSPITPIGDRKPAYGTSIPNRPTSGTPAPWAPRLSVLARIPSTNKNEDGDERGLLKPVFVGDFPQSVHDEQKIFLRQHAPGDANLSGGFDKQTCLSWIVCRNKLFIWSYLSSTALKRCMNFELPSDVIENGDFDRDSYHHTRWLLAVVNWDSCSGGTHTVAPHGNSTGVVMCNQITRSVLYWPDIYSDAVRTPVTSFASSNESSSNSLPIDGKITSNRQQQRSKLGSGSVESISFNSLIVSAIPNVDYACVALVSGCRGELWQFYCSPAGIFRNKIYQDIKCLSSQENDCSQHGEIRGYPRSLIWRFPLNVKESNRQFFLLTDHDIQCFSIDISAADFTLSKLWSHEIVATDGDSGIQKNLAGQKQIWPLDIQVDDYGRVITVLVATFCKDRISSSSYTQYSLLTMQYRSEAGISAEAHDRVLEKKAPIQVIIPKARVEEENFLFSMRLRVGCKPSGSAIILSSDGTATVSYYRNFTTRLYQFDLPYDAGKVLDASVLPSTDDGEDGPWVVLTDKAGIWAIPEKAILLGGVEPPERSLSRKGSSNERLAQEERRNLMFEGNLAPRRASSDVWVTGDRQQNIMSGVARRSAQDEESEVLLSKFFHDYLPSGKVDGVLEKLRNSGTFERDGGTNVFARKSKAIVDILPKHWTTSRGAEILAMSAVLNQLMDKQQKHESYLQFLALSKCHEDLCSCSRHSLQMILEHGEKLAAMLQIRELQCVTSQNRSTTAVYPSLTYENQTSNALWDLIQLVGEMARRNTVLLMDRDNAEVFYSRVSELEQLFYCLEKQLDYVISIEQSIMVQTQRSCEISNACVAIIHTAMRYKDEHRLWYPPPEGLTFWYCQPIVRNGLWSVASFMLHLLKETSGLDTSSKSELYTHLEVLADVILEAFRGAITAKMEQGEEHKGLLDEYWNTRNIILGSLYQQVKGVIEAEYKDICGSEEQREENLKNLSSSLLSIAKRHEGYQTMWDICYDLNDSVLLRDLMHDSMGPKGGFSYFVFTQLYSKKQFSKLLRLGEEFHEEVSIYLKHHRDMLWLHEIFLHHFSSASNTLHDVALCQDNRSVMSDEDEMNDGRSNKQPTLADRRRYLNLAKIAAFAGVKDADADADMKVRRIEADLKILKLQEKLIDVPSDENQQLLGTEEVIKQCLGSGNRDLVLQVFDVFAWTGLSFHRDLLEECWKNAAEQDDWEQLHQTSITEGWSDEETLQHLSHTLLFHASSKCYGSRANTVEDGGFEKVLPLRQESSLVPDSNSSVEAILMQHRDYAYAGKLMLTAIMLGST